MLFHRSFHVAAVGFALILSPAVANAQLKGARDYTKRIAPLVPPPPSPSRPAPPPRPVATPAPAQPPRPVDPEKAKAKQQETLRKTIEFQKKRAADGSPSAQYDLGLRYLNGDGLVQDNALGRKWLAESAKNGNSLATAKLKELDAAQTPQDAH